VSRPSLEERLRDGAVPGTQGHVFELERRGSIKAGPFPPDVVLDFPVPDNRHAYWRGAFFSCIALRKPHAN
jgi:hypothetical protein